MSAIPFVIGLAVVTLLFFVLANLRGARDVLSAGVLLRFYLHIASFVTLVVLVAGLIYSATGLFSLRSIDFSYSRGVSFPPAVAVSPAGGTTPTVDQQAKQQQFQQQQFERQKDQQSTDLIRGGTLTVIGGLLFGLHTVLRWRQARGDEPDTAGNFYRGYLIVGLVTFGVVGLVALPEAARILRRSPRRLPLFCLLLAGGLAILALAWGVILLVALPRGLGHLMLGNLWKPTYPLVLPATILVIGSCLRTGAGMGLHALGAARRSLRVMLIATTASVVLGIAGAAAGGAVWAMAGFAVGSWTGVFISWRQLRVAMREYNAKPAGTASRSATSAERRPAADEPGRQLQS